jgi:membrane fusion protein, multidrug efflux system
VRLTQYEKRYQALGTASSIAAAMISSPVAEEVNKVWFNSGDKVAAGDILVQLDDREETLAKELAALQLANARSLLTRYETAGKQGGVPESDVDKARLDVAAAEIELKQAELALLQRKIIAPFDGIVGIPLVNRGDRLAIGQEITTIENRKQLWIEFAVPEALTAYALAALEASASIDMTTPAYPDVAFNATITDVDNRLITEQRLLKLRATIDNKADKLRSGMSFTIIWNIEGKQYPTLPEIALQWERKGAYVWAVREGKAAKVPVQVIARNDGAILVSAALKEGDMIVTEGLHRIREGIAVTLINEEAE